MAAENKENGKLKLYSNWRSSCSQRVRIALNLKALGYEYKAMNLLTGDQFDPEYAKLNPMNYVPALVDNGLVITDSFAIILYLEEKYPDHPLMPQDLQKKTLNLQVASIVSSSIQPYHFLAVQSFNWETLNADEKLAWTQHYINKGFTALEKLLKGAAGKYATGDEPLLADVFLAPQILTAVTRFQIDMSPYPTLARVNEAYNEVPAFVAALPAMQPDAPSPAQAAL